MSKMWLEPGDLQGGIYEVMKRTAVLFITCVAAGLGYVVTGVCQADALSSVSPSWGDLWEHRLHDTRPGCNAIDTGAVLQNITDGFTGRAPDLGAYEYGVPLPHYGPRSAQ